MTLSHAMHQSFGQYKIFFEKITGNPHAYQIGTFLPRMLSHPLPVTRTLFTHPTIDPPSERCLRACYAHPVCRVQRLESGQKQVSDYADGAKQG